MADKFEEKNTLLYYVEFKIHEMKRKAPFPLAGRLLSCFILTACDDCLMTNARREVLKSHIRLTSKPIGTARACTTKYNVILLVLVLVAGRRYQFSLSL